MALYTIRKTTRECKGVEIERYELYRGEEYIDGIDMPKDPSHNWFWLATKRIRANLLRRHDDPTPQFGAYAEDQYALAFAEMLNA